jgi:predicted AAA+ superfamily ATPase
MWLPREVSDRVRELARAFPALIVTGARQTGKTSLLRRLFPEHDYVSLDLRAFAEEAEESPRTFLAAHPPPVLIDEVQYAPGLFRHLKVAIDADRAARGQFILTGSQRFTLMKEVSDSLAGRCAILSLPGLTVREIRSSGWTPAEPRAHAELIVRGAFPELWADRSIPFREFYQAYVATYLERDLRQLLRVGSLRDFERFLRACAARAGHTLNKSELARDVGISQTTSSEWISALEAGNQIVLLEPFFANVGKRLVKAPKLYFSDTGLLCFLLGVTPEAVGTSPLTGALFENFVFSELAKWIGYFRPDWSLWFYRDQQQREADFLIQGPWHHVRVLDAKWSETPPQQAFAACETVAAILAGARDITETEVAVVSRTETSHRMGERRSLVSAFDIAAFLAGDTGSS